MEEIVGILIALFILVVIAFVIVICPILCLVKICKMATLECCVAILSKYKNFTCKN